MNASARILIVEPHENRRVFLERFLALQGLRAGFCAVGAAASADYAGVIEMGDVLPYPCRMGAILEKAEALLKKMQAGPIAGIKIGPYILDAMTSTLSMPGKSEIKLTEKERDILVILDQAQSRPVGRDVLLKKVWAYVQGVETHTLETHIYRLRQKIEKDPAKPKILLTNDDGYYLGLS